MTPAATSETALLVVGSAARDLDSTDPRGWRLGGTVGFAALAAARMGVNTRVLVGVDSEAATAHELDLLRTAGAEVELVPLDRGPVFANEQTPRGRRQVGHQASDPIPISALTRGWRDAEIVLLGAVATEIGDDWASISETAFVAVALQGLLREIVPGEQVRRLPLRSSALTARADLLMMGRDDIAEGGERLGDLLRVGQQLVITCGADGAIALQRAGDRIAGRAVPALAPRRTVDETGAGDVFLAALCAGRLLARGADDAHLLAFATAAASASVEGRGLEKIPSAAAICTALLRLRDDLHRGAIERES